MLHPSEVLGMQRALGNQAVQRLLAERSRGGAGKEPPRSESPVAEVAATGASPGDVQRKVGFELEMSVLTDIGGADPGYGVKLHEGRNFDVTVDHNTALKPMTEKAATKQGESGVAAPYTSIIELVTKPIDETAPDGVARFNEVSLAVLLFAKKVRAATQGFDHRVPLDEVVPTAMEGAHVGLDTARLEIANLQALDANIQATVGVDPAQAPALLSYMGSAVKPETPPPFLQDVTPRISQEQAKAAQLSNWVVGKFKEKYGLEDSVENQGFANLGGLLSFVVLYLRAAALWSHWSETLGDVAPIDAMSKKNFTPLLSHTDLGSLKGATLTPDEELELFGKTGWLSNAILLAGRSNLGFEVNQNLPMLKWGSAARIGPTPGVFVGNVLAGRPDGLTAAILPEPKRKPVEAVGPRVPTDPVVAPRMEMANGLGLEEWEGAEELGLEPEPPDDERRRGAVVEFRSLANRLPGLQSKLGASKFPVNAWEVLLSDVFYTVRELSMRGGDSPAYKKSRAKRPG
jgi:hypothetical protein